MFFYTFLPKLLNMSLTASVVIVFVLLLRFLMKKAPKVISYALWGVVLFRLLCPVSIESGLSLFGLFETPVTESGTITSSIEYVPQDIVHTEYPEVVMPVPGLGDVINESLPQGEEQLVADPLEAPMAIATYVWMLGVLGMLVYAGVSYVQLRKKLITASPLRENIYLVDEITSPFVMGLFAPKIYLPSALEEREQSYIILHEQHHIHRLDHITKALAFIALSIHWFNPLVWIAFIMAGKDMEMSCDEAVVKKLGDGVLADYTASLLSLATGKQIIAGTPLAFGEGDTKGRIRNLANWKKPGVWVMLVAVVACAVLAMCLLTNPSKQQPVLMGANYEIEGILYDVTVGDEETSEPPLQYCVTADYHLYFQQTESDGWTYLGKMEDYALTNEELSSYMPVDELRKKTNIRQITDSYILRVEDNNFYLVFQTKNGDTYLAYGWEDISERGQVGSDDTRLRRLYHLKSSFYEGYVNGNFFQRSLRNVVGANVYAFASYENDDVPGYHIEGFKCGESSNHEEMTDMGFAVFQTTGDGYRLIDCKVYEDAVLAENGVYFCPDPAVADVNGEMRNDNTFDVVLVCNEKVGRIERVYHMDGKEDVTLSNANINTHCMSLWSWEYSDDCVSISQHVYDKDGNLMSAPGTVPVNSASWEDIAPGTVYVSYQCIYMNPLSSYAAIGGDSGYKYIKGDDYFAMESRLNYAIDAEIIHTFDSTGSTGEVDSIREEGDSIPVEKWEWQAFPYTNEEWNALYEIDIFAMLNIRDMYEEILYQPLTEQLFLLRVDGDIWLVELKRNYIWSIYSLVPESAMGVVQWEYRPELSSRSPVFQFQFDMEYTEVSAICVEGGLVEFNYGDKSGVELTVPTGYPLCWSPMVDEKINQKVKIHFTVHTDDEVPYNGVLYIEGKKDAENGHMIYTASLVGTGLHLSQNTEGEGGIISLAADVE